ncbi:MAG: hypothetical protein GC191_09195 [Azospirillum sp.]|nr:hypothetical protein [Azospirillum sp.]
MKLSPSAFSALLGEMGQDVLWRRANICPCRDEYSGAATQGCAVCDARGVFWDAAVEAWTGLAGAKSVREWSHFGMWESGDVVFTIPGDSPLYAAAEFDRVVMINSSEAFSVPLVRGVSGERLSFPVLRVDSAIWIADGAIVNGDLPAIAGDGSVDWSGVALAPDVGTQYSLSGRRHTEYFIFKDLVQDRAHFHGLALPRKVVARRFDLFGR